MPTTIKLKNGSGAPLATDLVQGEVALDLTNKRIYSENASGTVIEMGTSPSTIDINAGTIDGTIIGGASAAAGTFTTLNATGGGALTGTWSDLGTVTTADIDGGTIDGVTIGGASAGAGTFTTFTSTGIDDNATSTAITIDSNENVGIGTTAPSSNLTVSNSVDGSGPVIELANTFYSASSTDERVDFQGSFYQNDVSVLRAAGYIRFGKSGDFASNANASAFISFTTRNAGTLAERLRIDSSGNLLVGTTNSVVWNTTNVGVVIGGVSGSAIQVSRANDTTLLLNRLSSDGLIQQFAREGVSVGSVSVSASATTYNTSSDYRLKNITGPITNSGEYIDSLNPVEGTWKVDGSTFVGLIAHEVQEVSKTPVATGEKDGEEMQGMDYSSAEIIANLIAEVKALRQRVHALESK